MSREILQVSGLSMRFGGLLAVNGVGLTVKEKQVVALIGPNGAGKTTVFNCLTGFYKPSGGTILLDGQPIQGLAGHQIARKGVVRTFQNVRLFKEMTALENLLIAQHRQQAAEAHAQAADLQNFAAHRRSSIWGRCMGSRPCGRQIIINTISAPNISMRYSLNSRISSGSRIITMAARITPS